MKQLFLSLAKEDDEKTLLFYDNALDKANIIGYTINIQNKLNIIRCGRESGAVCHLPSSYRAVDSWTAAGREPHRFGSGAGQTVFHDADECLSGGQAAGAARHRGAKQTCRHPGDRADESCTAAPAQVRNDAADLRDSQPEQL